MTSVWYAQVIDIKTTWTVLAPTLDQEKRQVQAPPLSPSHICFNFSAFLHVTIHCADSLTCRSRPLVVHRICELFSLVPEVESESDEYQVNYAPVVLPVTPLPHCLFCSESHLTLIPAQIIVSD